MSELNTFGAVMSFAIDLESQLRDYYQAVGDTGRAADADKRRANLERVRRENVTEIKLEAIDDLSADDYTLDVSDVSPAGQARNEAAAARFYAAAAPKINVREAQRALEKTGKQHAQLAG